MGYGAVVDGFARFQALNSGISAPDISENFYVQPAKQGILLLISGPEKQISGLKSGHSTNPCPTFCWLRNRSAVLKATIFCQISPQQSPGSSGRSTSHDILYPCWARTNEDKIGSVSASPVHDALSALKSQRFLRFAIAMPIADPRNRAISETRDSNDALRFKGAMEIR